MLVSLKPTVTACWHWQNVKSDFLSDGVWWRREFCSFYDKKWKLCTPSDSKRRAQYFNGRCRVNGNIICPLRGAVFNSMLIFLSWRQRWNNLITNQIKNLQSCSSYIITLFTQVALIPEGLRHCLTCWIGNRRVRNLLSWKWVPDSAQQRPVHLYAQILFCTSS